MTRRKASGGHRGIAGQPLVRSSLGVTFARSSASGPGNLVIPDRRGAASPESITPICEPMLCREFVALCGYGFRAPRFARPRNDDRVAREVIRHSGSPRSGESGIHNPDSRANALRQFGALCRYGFRAPRFARPRNDDAGSILRSQGLVEIDPLGVGSFDQVYLPLAPPLLDFFFSCNGGQWIVIGLEPNQQMDTIPRSKSLSRASLVLVCATKKITSHPNVESAVLSTCQQIDVVRPSHRWLRILGRRLARRGE